MEITKRRGHLTLLRRATRDENIELSAHRKKLKYYGLFQCDCGNQKFIALDDVFCKQTQSCGCLRRGFYNQKKPKQIKRDQTYHSNVFKMNEDEFVSEMMKPNRRKYDI